MKPVEFRRRAELELLEAIDWYEEQRPGLGADLEVEVATALVRIQEHPEVFPVAYRQLRRALLVRFPYGIYFREMSDVIVVVSVFHLHRDLNGLQDT